MKPIAWICFAATAVVAGTLPTSARACSLDYELIDDVTFDGAVPDCLEIDATYDDEDPGNFDGNYILVVRVEETCADEVVLETAEHEVVSETSRTDPDTGVTTVEIRTATLVSEHFGEELEVPIAWTIDGVTEDTTMTVKVVDDNPRDDDGDSGFGCGCSVSTHVPTSVLWFGLLGLGFVHGRRKHGRVARR